MTSTPEDPRIKYRREEIKNYLKQSPADPHHTTGVNPFCHWGMQLLLGFINANYAIRYPKLDNEEVLHDSLYSATYDETAFNRGFRTREDFKRQNGSILLTPPKKFPHGNPPPQAFGGIIYAASFVDPSLPRYEYANLLDTKQKSTEKSDEFGAEDIDQGTFKGYNYRYQMFMRLSGLPPQSPLARLFALGLLEDVAKKQAVEAIKTQLLTVVPAKPSFVFVPPEEIDQVVTNFKSQIAPTQYHLGYLSRVIAAEDRIIEAQGLVDDQPQLLKDLAFFHRGKLANGVLTTLLTPIMRSVGELGWDDASDARDFLLKNFKGCFPKWRQAGYPEGVTYTDINSLARNRRSLAGVPYLYQQLIEDEVNSIEAGERFQRQAAVRQQTENREEKRQERLIRKFQMYTLAAISKSQFPDSQPFNPNKPISQTNPLTLTFKFQVQKPGDEKTPIAYRQTITSQEDDLLIASNRTIPFERLFFNLLYEGGLTADTLRQAFEDLKLSERVEETVTPAILFDKIAQPRLTIFNRDLVQRGTGLATKNLSSKIQLIQNVLKELNNK